MSQQINELVTRYQHSRLDTDFSALYDKCKNYIDGLVKKKYFRYGDNMFFVDYDDIRQIAVMSFHKAAIDWDESKSRKKSFLLHALNVAGTEIDKRCFEATGVMRIPHGSKHFLKQKGVTVKRDYENIEEYHDNSPRSIDDDYLVMVDLISELTIIDDQIIDAIVSDYKLTRMVLDCDTISEEVKDMIANHFLQRDSKNLVQ